MNVLNNVRQTEVVQELAERTDPLLLAVSGGPDSTAMLHMFARFVEREEFSCNVYVGHVQHDLREEGPEKDLQFVRDVSRELNVPFVSRSVSVQAEVNGRDVSPEEAAREKRYYALQDMCRETGCKVVLTAHHRDDQVETILLRLLDGTGIQGLQGIRRRRLLKSNSRERDQTEQIELVRPLLSIPRESIVKYLEYNDFSWRTDPSNQELRFRRNFVREKLKPIVRNYLGSSFPDLLLRIRHRAERINTKLRNHWKSVDLAATRKNNLFMMNRNQVEDLSPMLYPYFLRWIKKNLSLEKIGLRTHDFERVYQLLSSGKTGREERLSDGIQIRLEHKYVVARQQDENGCNNHSIKSRKRLTMPGRTRWEQFRFHTFPLKKINQFIDANESDPWKEVVDVSQIIGPLSITTRREGDRIRPIGFSGHKKVTDLMIDHKVPQSERDTWPIIRDQCGIVWIPGLRMAHRLRITNQTHRKHAFSIQCRKTEADRSIKQ